MSAYLISLVIPLFRKKVVVNILIKKKLHSGWLNKSLCKYHVRELLKLKPRLSRSSQESPEIKNVSSFHDLEKAIHFELTRQQSLVERNIPVISETRQWDDKRKITVSARTKEEEQGIS